MITGDQQLRSLTLQQRFSRLSLRKKLSILISSVSFLIVTLAIAASFFIELGFFRTRLLEEYENTALIIASNLESSVTFAEAFDANDQLSVLELRDQVTSAAVYLQNGTLLASFRRSNLPDSPPPPPRDAITELKGNSLVVNQPILLDGVPIGTFTLSATLDEISTFLVSRIWIFTALAFLGLGLTAFLASVLARILSRPILELADTAQRISREQDFSMRHKRLADDETGRLVDSFNEMMERIEQREGEILSEKERAEASSRAKDDFLSVISHELRTPLNPIIGYVEILLRKIEAAEDRRQLALVRQYAEHLQSLIDDVIDYSRFERGALAMQSDTVDIKRLCENSVSLLEQNASGKELELHCLYETDTKNPPPHNSILIDRTRLQQVILNLITNSLKFTETGSVTLVSKLIPTDNNSFNLRLEVRDTGIGIAPENRDKVFAPFSQIDATLTRQHSGMGLGLAISQRIVHAMGGIIDFFSESGKGTTFWLEIPVRLSETEEQSGTDIQEINTNAKGRVLLVDDQLVNLELGESLLESCGLEVVCARSGKDAVRIANEQAFSLVIMDIKMPRMDGYETARAIRSLGNDNARLPIIAMTAHVTTRGNEECFEAGMDDLISKPFTTKKLNLILNRWLGDKLYPRG